MRSNHQIKTTAALVLALAATAPAAAANTTGTNPVIRPNPDQQVLTSPPRPADPRPAPSPEVHPNPDQQATTASTSPHSEVIDNGGYGPGTPAPPIARVLAPSRGFDWGAAGIGAAGALGVTFLGLGGALLISQRRGRPTRSSQR